VVHSRRERVTLSAFGGREVMIFKPLTVSVIKITGTVLFNQLILRRFKLIEELVFNHQPLVYLLLLCFAELSEKILPDLFLITGIESHSH
jgi:hypothetical protein